MTSCECGCGQQVRRRFARGHNRNRRKAREADYRIEDRGHATPCWIWLGSINDQGYGLVWKDGAMQRAHRALWETEHGPVPEGLEPDHLCRVRCCVNPEHLEIVTHAENIRRCAHATPEPIRQAVLAAVGGQREIARQFGIDHKTVARIRGAG